MESRLPVLIVGAGPTGLLLAIWLTHFNVPFRIIDKATSAGQDSRAIVVHTRTLEFYDQLGIANQTISLGELIQDLKVTYNGTTRSAMNLPSAGKGQSRYPTVLSLAQNEQEAMLEQELRLRGGSVERGTELINLTQHDDHVEVVLHTTDKSRPDETLMVSYVAGCDGAHSQVRRFSDISMEGGTYHQRFFVADVKAHSPILDAGPNLNLFMSRNDFIVAVRMKGTNCARFIGFVPDHLNHSETVTYQDCEPSMLRNLGSQVRIDSVDWFSHYRVHHLAANEFRKKRVFILGDAGHLHTPVGGQGMNTGLGDATNLAWKLAQVYHSQLGHDDDRLDALLDTYDTERSAFARTLVQTTDYVFQILTSNSWASYFMRNWLVPYVLPFVLKWSYLAPIFYVRVSQLGIDYRSSKFSQMIGQTKGKVRPGDRLPWVERLRLDGEQEEIDNHVLLRKACWQGHVYGCVEPFVKEVLEDVRVPLCMFTCTQEASQKGLGRDELYLVRPDGHIGLVFASRGVEGKNELQQYLREWVVAG